MSKATINVKYKVEGSHEAGVWRVPGYSIRTREDWQNMAGDGMLGRIAEAVLKYIARTLPVPEKGNYIKAELRNGETVEGEVTRVNTLKHGHYTVVEVDDRLNFILHTEFHEDSEVAGDIMWWTHVERPKPEWKVGDVVPAGAETVGRRWSGLYEGGDNDGVTRVVNYKPDARPVFDRRIVWIEDEDA